MKKIKNVQKVLLMLVIFALICGVSTIIKATEGEVGDIRDIPYKNNNVVQDNTPTQNEPQNIPVSNIGGVGNTNTNTNTNTSLPKTGVNDSAMWVLIGVCTIAAIYTYKKVRDYNI